MKKKKLQKELKKLKKRLKGQLRKRLDLDKPQDFLFLGKIKGTGSLLKGCRKALCASKK